MSRTVSLYYYLGIPAVVGGIMVIIMLLAALRYVRLYTADGRPLRWRDRAYWVRPLSAAGAWSLNDSWATNITTMITLLATILGVTTASSALFPGVALDRFVIVNIVAGGIVAVAPLAFGVFYAGWTRHNPGIMADASLVLPQATAVKLASPAKVALARNTAVVLASGGRKNLRAAAVATVARAMVIQLPGGRYQRNAGDGRLGLAGRRQQGPGGHRRIAVRRGRHAARRRHGHRRRRRPAGPGHGKKGHTVHVPPQTWISILAGAVMTIPGTADITVDTASTLVVHRGGTGGGLAIPSDDVDPGHAPRFPRHQEPGHYLRRPTCAQNAASRSRQAATSCSETCE